MNINKIKEYWSKSSIWKQGFFIGLSIFIIVFAYSIFLYEQSNSDMSGLALFIPLFFFEFVLQKFYILNLPDLISILMNLGLYYLIGVLISLITKKITK